MQCVRRASLKPVLYHNFILYCASKIIVSFILYLLDIYKSTIQVSHLYIELQVSAVVEIIVSR